jgi:hypothetical protein
MSDLQWEIVGALVLAVMALLSEAFHSMPLEKTISAWAFPRSDRKRSKASTIVFTAVAFPLLLAGWAVAVSGDYFNAKILFFFAWFSATCGLWLSLVVLASAARVIWTVLSSSVVAVMLCALYIVLCPTATISPRHVTFSAAFTGDDGFSETYAFRVQNKIDDDIYGVVFKLRVQSPATKEVFKVDAPNHRFGDITIQICTDSKNRQVFQGVIARLRPHDSQEINLTHVNPHAESTPASGPPSHISLPDTRNGITVDANIVNFNYAEAQLHRPGSQLTSFYNVETLKCTGMAW